MKTLLRRCRLLLGGLMVVLMATTNAFGQSITLSGTITDGETGEPLPGVTIRVKDQGRGTITDLDGKYSVSVSPDDVLLISSVGFKTQEIAVNGRTTINVTLESDVQALKEIVVVGYGTQKRSELSGAVDMVTAEEFSDAPVLRMEQALQGRAAGVQISQNSGSPGAGLALRVRGAGTINDPRPLILVDGVQVDGTEFLNPGDIETISVLKDASAAGIYGARAANGVILITTKTGKKEQPAQLSYAGYYGVQTLARKMDLMNAEQYATYQLALNGGPFTGEEAELNDPSALGAGTDWQDAIFDPAPIQNHQISVTGGSTNSQYAVSGNIFQQNGIVGGRKSNFVRYTGRFNGTYDVLPYLTIGNKINLVSFTRNGLPENDEFSSPVARALNYDPVTPLYDENGNYVASIYQDTDLRNPANQIDLTYNTWENNRVLAQVFAELKPTDWLSIKSTGSRDISMADQFIFNPFYILDSANTVDRNETSSAQKAKYRWNTVLWENTANIDFTVGEKHHIQSVLGSTFQENTYEMLGTSLQDLGVIDPEDIFMITTAEDTVITWESFAESALFSVFGRVNYSYDEKYSVTALLRRDGSSKFGPEARYGYFPSMSVAWTASEEQFIRDLLPPVSFLKVRASWGQNGNDRIGDYSYFAVLAINQNYTFGQSEIVNPGVAPGTARNPELRWETTTISNIGFDLGMWDDRFSFSFDAFQKLTTDMLLTIDLPGHTGAGTSQANVGSVKVQGLEFAGSWRQYLGDWSYDVGMNATWMRNEVIDLAGNDLPRGFNQGVGENISLTEVGMPMAYFYGYETDGIFQNRFEVDEHASQPGAAAGDLRFVDQNGDGVINADDKVMIGNPIPDWTFGITANATWRNWDANLLIQGVLGNQIYNATARLDFNSVNLPTNRLDFWTEDNPSQTEPRAVSTGANQANNIKVSDYFVENGSYARVKNFQIGYTLPEAALERIQVRTIRFYVGGSNLLTLTNYSGLDPDLGTRSEGNQGGTLDVGIDRGFYPAPRIVQAGLNVTF